MNFIERQAKKCNLFEEMRALRRDSRIKPPLREAFEWVYHMSGGRPEHIVVSTKFLAYEFGVSLRTAERWLLKLAELGLIEIIQRWERRGMVRLFVYQPRISEREPRPDLQGRFDFDAAEVEATGGAVVSPSQPQATSSAHAVSPSQPQATSSAHAVSPSGIESRPIPSRERAPASLSTLSTVDDDDSMGELWEPIGLRAGIAWATIHSHRPHAKIAPDWKLFALSVVAAAELLHSEEHDWRGWIERSARTTRTAKADDPPGYFRGVLRNNLIEDLAVVGCEAEAKALLGSILARTRGAVQRRMRSLAADRWTVAAPRAKPEPPPAHGSEGDSEPAEQDQQNEPQEGEQ